MSLWWLFTFDPISVAKYSKIGYGNIYHRRVLHENNKTKLFAKWANKNDVSDKSLHKAAQEIMEQNYDANYGGGVIKKRIATKG